MGKVRSRLDRMLRKKISSGERLFVRSEGSLVATTILGSSIIVPHHSEGFILGFGSTKKEMWISFIGFGDLLITRDHLSNDYIRLIRVNE